MLSAPSALLPANNSAKSRCIQMLTVEKVARCRNLLQKVHGSE